MLQNVDFVYGGKQYTVSWTMEDGYKIYEIVGKNIKDVSENEELYSYGLKEYWKENG